MTKFESKLMESTMVGGTHEHTPFRIFKDGEWVGNGINVVTPEGKRFIRIFNHNKELAVEMFEYYFSRKGVSEVTFSNPFNG